MHEECGRWEKTVPGEGTTDTGPGRGRTRREHRIALSAHSGDLGWHQESGTEGGFPGGTQPRQPKGS